jgi:hypothetical protein
MHPTGAAGACQCRSILEGSGDLGVRALGRKRKVEGAQDRIVDDLRNESVGAPSLVRGHALVDDRREQRVREANRPVLTLDPCAANAGSSTSSMTPTSAMSAADGLGAGRARDERARRGRSPQCGCRVRRIARGGRAGACRPTQLGVGIAACSPEHQSRSGRRGRTRLSPAYWASTCWLFCSIVAAPAEGEKMLVWPSSQRTS